MASTRRTTDLWLTLLTLALLVISPIENAIGNNLPQMLPDPVANHALSIFATLLGTIVLVDLVLVVLRRRLADNAVDARRRRLRNGNVIFTVILAILSACAGIIGPVAVIQIPALAALTKQSWTTVSLPLLLLALLIALPLLADRLSDRPALEVNERRIFLRQLTRAYNRFLDDPLQRAISAALSLEETPEALQWPEFTIEPLGRIAPSTTTVVPSDQWDAPPSAYTETLAPTQTLLPVFERAHCQLLILGAPGAGKSTQLYALGRALVSDAQTDSSARIPVILDLSTWAANKDRLDVWMAAELAETYNVRADIARRWVREEKLLPLLDALDVMPDADRPRCVATINAYLAEHSGAPLVVCSRHDEYNQIKSDRLNLQQAVTFQPLTDAAIAAALAAGGDQLATLRQVVASDGDLRDAMRTPLLLSLVILTYGDLRAEDIPLPRLGETEAWRSQLLRSYVERMLSRVPGAEPPRLHYTPEQFQMTLAWLGYELRLRDRNTFLLENLQPNWLPDADAKRRYAHELRLICLFFGLATGILGAVAFGLVFALGTAGGDALNRGLVGACFGLVIFGLGGGVICDESIEASGVVEPLGRVRWSWPRVRTWLLGTLVGGTVGGLVLGLFGGFVVVVTGWFGIDPIAAAGTNHRIGFADNLLGALRTELLIGPLLGLVAGLLFGLWQGFDFLRVDEQDLRRPNEGIRRTIQLAALILTFLGLVFGLIGSLVLGLLLSFVYARSGDLSSDLIGGFFGGILFGLEFGVPVALKSVGGSDVLRHLALRRTLRWSTVVPAGFVRFLDEATVRVLLRRVGGGYQFIHRLLRDDFAKQYTASPDN